MDPNLVDQKRQPLNIGDIVAYASLSYGKARLRCGVVDDVQENRLVIRGDTGHIVYRSIPADRVVEEVVKI